MKRNSLSTKLFAMLLCVVMVIGCLPLSAFATDWEGDIDIAAGLSAENPINFQFTFSEDGEPYGYYIPETQNGITYYQTNVKNGEWIFAVSGDAGYKLTVNGQTVEVDEEGHASVNVTFNQMLGQTTLAFAIEGTGSYYIDLSTMPAPGTPENPDAAFIGDNYATVLNGNQMGHFFKFVAEETGDIEFKITEITKGVAADVSITNMETYANRSIDADGVDGVAKIAVEAGQELQIQVVVLPDADWNYPEVDAYITFNLAYAPTGPIVVESFNFFTVGLSFAQYIGIQPAMLHAVVANYDSYYVEAVQKTANKGDIVTVLEPIVFEGYNVYDLQLLPRAMTDDVILTIYAEKDGVKYQGVPVETSITKLALDKLAEYNGKNDSAACKVLVDMIKYGAEVQKAFNYKTTDLPTDYLGEYASMGTSEIPEINAAVATSGSGIAVLANSLSMGSKVEVQFMFTTASVEGCEMRYTLAGKTETISASEFDQESLPGYSVAIFALKPRNFRDNITVAVYNTETGEAISAIYTISVEAYAKQHVGKEKNDLVVAMMQYGDSVLAKFG